MYNEDIKIRFLREMTVKEERTSFGVALFELTEPCEEKWNLDLYYLPKNTYSHVLDKVVNGDRRIRNRQTRLINKYVLWCKNQPEFKQSKPSGQDVMNATESLNVLERFVSSPMHLQKCLDEIFLPESMETVDNVWRCYFWLAYGGVKYEDVTRIKSSDVDFSRMIIKYNGTEVPIYREAALAFSNAVNLKSFIVYKRDFKSKQVVDRFLSDTLIRSKTEPNIYTIKSYISKTVSKAIDAKKTNIRIGYKDVCLSGAFYRMYEREIIGIRADFSGLVALYSDSKSRSFIKKSAGLYYDEYLAWKETYHTT